jgi:hypothetical protein
LKAAPFPRGLGCGSPCRFSHVRPIDSQSGRDYRRPGRQRTMRDAQTQPAATEF